jgi:hypothetical protein
MKHKIEAIDYLRGLSILMIILIHIIMPVPFNNPTDYSRLRSLYMLRDILNFCVVTLVICSGFSLYYSSKNMEFTFKGIMEFYRKRLSRLLFPLVLFWIVSFVFYGVIALFFRPVLIEMGTMYNVLTKYKVASLPVGWIMVRWIVLLMILLTILFPFLKHLYEKSKYSIALIILTYFISSGLLLRNPIQVIQFPDVGLTIMSGVAGALSFLTGWCIVYIMGFYLEEIYNESRLMKKELNLTFNFILLFGAIYIVYKINGLSTSFTMNKFPPLPYYLSFGIGMTFILLNLFFAYKHFIHSHLRKVLGYFSSNSYWLFLWSYIAIIMFGYVFSLLDFINIYIRLILEFVMSLVLVVLMVQLQKSLIKIEMHKEKHHF